jgi:hypothetical protein
VEAEDLNEVRTGRAIRSPLTAAPPTIVAHTTGRKNIAQRRSTHSICPPSPILAMEPAGQRSRGAVGRRGDRRSGSDPPYRCRFPHGLCRKGKFLFTGETRR